MCDSIAWEPEPQNFDIEEINLFGRSKSQAKLKLFEEKKWQPKVEMLQVLENLKQILLSQITELGYVNVLFERSLPETNDADPNNITTTHDSS